MAFEVVLRSVFFLFVLGGLSVVGGVYVVVGGTVCFLGVRLVCRGYCSVCVLGEGLGAGVRRLWCLVVSSFVGVFGVVCRGVSRSYFLFRVKAVSILRIVSAFGSR